MKQLPYTVFTYQGFYYLVKKKGSRVLGQGTGGEIGQYDIIASTQYPENTFDTTSNVFYKNEWVKDIETVEEFVEEFFIDLL